MADNFDNKITEKFVCEQCDYKSSRLSEWNRHLLTQKHIRLTQTDKLDTTYNCNCGNTYKHRQSLYKHKLNCKIIKEDNKQEVTIFKEEKEEITVSDAKMMFDMFKEFMIEQNKSMIELFKNNTAVTNNNNNNINNGNINNNYNQFNIQMYLNETCKNAMTIDEFLEYLQPTLEELEDTARLGYVEGITRIIMRGLKDLEEELLPFHCSDLKRESLFVKNSEGIWEKETDEKPLMLKFVKAVARKNFNNVNEWRKLHPNSRYHDSKSNDMFNQIMLNSTSGRTEEEQQTNYNKIIKNIVKEVVIDKGKKNKK
jgi:hypothetical protein